MNLAIYEVDLDTYDNHELGARYKDGTVIDGSAFDNEDGEECFYLVTRQIAAALNFRDGDKVELMETGQEFTLMVSNSKRSPYLFNHRDGHRIKLNQSG
jgi:hypothetical protein|tara:strand:- start:3873 stop:4169 length:297 start_codon:yes stop_codon:yes gene_type:complete